MWNVDRSWMICVVSESSTSTSEHLGRCPRLVTTWGPFPRLEYQGGELSRFANPLIRERASARH